MPDRTIAEFGMPGHFYECPRWHDGRWWVSDMRGGAVYSFTPEGKQRVELRFEDRIGGLGFTPDGALLVVSMEHRKLLRVRPGGSGEVEHAFDLSGLFGETQGFLNDLAVSSTGHAYVGFDPDFTRYGRESELGAVVHVTPGGEVSVAATGLAFPNGMVFAPGEASLIVHETMKPRITAYEIAGDGSLGPGFVWAFLHPKRDERPDRSVPLPESETSLDGCAIDAEGCLWSADVGSGCLRVAEGGAILDAVFLPDNLHAMACGLGGPDGHTLMICGSDDNFHDRTSTKDGKLFVTRVEVPAL